MNKLHQLSFSFSRRKTITVHCPPHWFGVQWVTMSAAGGWIKQEKQVKISLEWLLLLLMITTVLHPAQTSQWLTVAFFQKLQSWTIKDHSSTKECQGLTWTVKDYQGILRNGEGRRMSQGSKVGTILYCTLSKYFYRSLKLSSCNRIGKIKLDKEKKIFIQILKSFFMVKYCLFWPFKFLNLKISKRTTSQNLWHSGYWYHLYPRVKLPYVLPLGHFFHHFLISGAREILSTSSFLITFPNQRTLWCADFNLVRKWVISGK